MATLVRSPIVQILQQLIQTIFQSQKKQQGKATEQAVSRQESLTLVRNLMRTSISTISYLRNLFPEDCYAVKKLGGLNIKSLLPNNPEARTLIGWMEKGVFDALDKKYLRSIIFGICTEEGDQIDNMLESSIVKVSYPEDSINFKISRIGANGKTEDEKTLTDSQKAALNSPQSKKEITQSMVMILRTIITLAQTLKPLPETRYLTMKLLYHDDVTPKDYEPAFFRALTAEEKKSFSQKQEMEKIKIGNVRTKYHSMFIKFRAQKSQKKLMIPNQSKNQKS